jgi:hypothetical protein
MSSLPPPAVTSRNLPPGMGRVGRPSRGCPSAPRCRPLTSASAGMTNFFFFKISTASPALTFAVPGPSAIAPQPFSSLPSLNISANDLGSRWDNSTALAPSAPRWTIVPGATSPPTPSRTTSEPSTSELTAGGSFGFASSPMSMSETFASAAAASVRRRARWRGIGRSVVPRCAANDDVDDDARTLEKDAAASRVGADPGRGAAAAARSEENAHRAERLAADANIDAGPIAFVVAEVMNERENWRRRCFGDRRSDGFSRDAATTLSFASFAVGEYRARRELCERRERGRDDAIGDEPSARVRTRRRVVKGSASTRRTG